jgi:eukaryotic-like serine/threonine-protein kinase
LTPGMVLNERYRIIAVLGEGGMARVFRAEDTRLGRVVALKTLHPRFAAQPEFVHRFEQEAQFAAGLTHPNIVAIYDRGRAGVIHYIVMEYVAGGSLKALIAREAPLPLERALPLIAQLGAALDAAHARGVIHRDIKPENVLLTPTGEIKVSDFGIARALTDPKQTATGMVLGSVSYVAPEQARGLPTSAASDLYSSGVVIYELLTGRLPFVSDTALGIAMQHVTQEPAPPSTHAPALPAAVDSAVLRSLSKNPAGRFPSGAAMTRAFAAADAAGHAASTRHRATATTVVASQGGNGGMAPTTGRVKPTGNAAGRTFGRSLILRPGLWLLLLLLSGGVVLAATHDWGSRFAGLPVSTPRVGTPTAARSFPTTAVVPTRQIQAGTVAGSPTRSAAPPPPAATATVIVQPSSTIPVSPTAGTGDTAEGLPVTGATATLRVTQSGTVANVYITFDGVPAGTAVGARWIFPDGSASDWAAGRAYGTNPSYYAYQEVGPPGRYQVAALVNGAIVAVQDFAVKEQPAASLVGNQSNSGQDNNGTIHGKGHAKRHGRGHG